MLLPGEIWARLRTSHELHIEPVAGHLSTSLPLPRSLTVFEGVADSNHNLQAKWILLAIVEFLAFLIP